MPSSSDFRISSKKHSTMSFASRLFNPTRSNKRSASSALVNVIMEPTPLGYLARCAAEAIAKYREESLHGRVDFCIRQCVLSILHKHQKRKAFFTFTYVFAAIDIKHLD